MLNQWSTTSRLLPTHSSSRGVSTLMIWARRRNSSNCERGSVDYDKPILNWNRLCHKFCPRLLFCDEIFLKKICLEFLPCVGGGAGRILSRLNCHIHIQPNLAAVKCIFQNCKTDLFRLIIVFVQIANCIFRNWWLYLPKLQNITVQITNLFWQNLPNIELLHLYATLFC